MYYTNNKLKNFLIFSAILMFSTSTQLFSQDISNQKSPTNNNFEEQKNVSDLNQNRASRRERRREQRRRNRRARRDREREREREAETQERNVPSQFEIAAMGGVKIFVNKNAWYSVSASELQNAGFATNVDTSNWRLISNGKEIPMKVNFDGSIEFYGVGTDTIYTDSNVYYLINGNETGLRISRLQPSPIGQGPDASDFPEKVTKKERNLCRQRKTKSRPVIGR